MYQMDIKERAVSLAVTRWKQKADEIERLLTDSEQHKIRQARDELSSLMPLIQTRRQTLRASTICIKISCDAKQLTSLKSEKGSYCSRRSSCASNNTSTVIEIETAAKTAELSAKLSFCLLEQEPGKQRMKLKRKQ